MIKLAKELSFFLSTAMQRVWGPHASPAIEHDPNARAGNYESHQVNAGLFGVLVSNRESRF
jgi:hypothetical protein